MSINLPCSDEMPEPCLSRRSLRVHAVLKSIGLLVLPQRWMKIVKEINNDRHARGRVIFDILNEPDAAGLRWELSSNTSIPSVTTTYLRFMDMAHAINPGVPAHGLPLAWF